MFLISSLYFRKTLLVPFRVGVALRSNVRHDDMSFLCFSTFYFLTELSLLVCKMFMIYLWYLCFRSLNYHDHYRPSSRHFPCNSSLSWWPWGFAKELDSDLFTDNLENAHWNDRVDFSWTHSPRNGCGVFVMQCESHMLYIALLIQEAIWTKFKM